MSKEARDLRHYYRGKEEKWELVRFIGKVVFIIVGVILIICLIVLASNYMCRDYYEMVLTTEYESLRYKANSINTRDEFGLLNNESIEEIQKAGFDKYYVDHTLALWPQSAGGTPWTATYFQSKGDPITDLHEDMAAEQKARTTYDNILRLVKDPEIADPIRFLRAREIVHYQRFGESLRIVQDNLDSKNFYAFNPEFDMSADCGCNAK
jgi:spore coat protein JC